MADQRASVPRVRPGRGTVRAVAVLTALTAACLLAAAYLTALAANRTAGVALGVGLAIATPAAVLGVVVARAAHRLGSHVARVGLLLTLLGLAVASTALKEVGWQALAVRRPGDLAAYDELAAVLDQSAMWVLVAVALLLLHFPDGRLPGPRWRPVPWVLVACAAADHAAAAFDTVPFRPPMEAVPRPWGPLPPALQAVGLVVFVAELVLVLACAWSLVGRYRRGDTATRARLKWLALAGLAVPLYPPLCGAEIALWGEPTWVSGAVVVAALVGIPLATAVAILRHDLYDVDKALAGTVTYALLTGGLVAIFAGGSFVGGLVLGRDSAGAAAATALCAAVLAPLRVRLQRVVDGRLYPQRRAALAAVAALARDAGSGRARPEELEAVLRAALRDDELRVGYRVPGTEGYVDAAGRPVPAAPATEVTLGGRPIGVLAGGRARPELLRQVAAGAATLVEVVRLRLEVAGALREAESSRARLLVASYSERRKLERDLHDGAQQRLTSLGMSLRLAQRHLGDGTVDVDGLLDAAVAELGTALAELRAIAYGLRPGRLDDGLDAALTDLIRRVPVAVDLDFDADRLPDEVATTAYYLVSEAVTNAVKHAAADRIGLRVRRTGSDVEIRISDDGRGGAILSGRSGLADRVAALGGTLRVESPAGQGTVIEAVLPCAS